MRIDERRGPPCLSLSPPLPRDPFLLSPIHIQRNATHQGVDVALLVHLDLGHVLRVLLLPLARHRVAVPEDEVHLQNMAYIGR